MYQSAPLLFDEIGIITEEAGGKSQKATDKVIKKLKERAGKLGANGLILDNVMVNKSAVMYGAWYIPSAETSMSAHAIFVRP